MNLSEIRKKAQQEKEAKTEVSVSTPGEAEEGTAEIAVNPVEPAPEASVQHILEEIRPAPLTCPEAPRAHPFDPLAVILAGRKAARGDNGTQTGIFSSESAGADFQELLCFRVAGEKYAVDIMEIKEIIKPREVTEVPRMPLYVSGVLSLRGIIIPVLNMHERLGHAVPDESGKERIIVVKRDEEFFGVTVDEVIQVVRVSSEGIEPPPAVLDGIDRDFVSGIGRFDGQMLILLNLEKVLDLSLY
jgi:purine-binding chemotaxis protein CheW